LLTASDDGLGRVSPERFSRAWIGLIVVSGLWGTGSALLWEAGIRVFGEYSGIPLVPAGMVLAASALCMYRRAVPALGGVLGGESRDQRALAAAVVVLFWGFLLLGLRGWQRDWAPYPWWLIRPQAMYRPLVLAPLWGAWAMLVGCQLSRPGPGTSEALRVFAAGCGPLVTTVCLGGLLAASILYFNYLPWTQLTIAGSAFACGLVCGWGFCRLAGGLNRRALLAANVLTQMVFLLAYLANRWSP
jgi:hypothetical protein